MPGMNVEQHEPRDALGGPSLQSLRLMQSVFGLEDEGNTSTSNKRSSPGSAENSLSGSITEQLHFEDIAPVEHAVQANLSNMHPTDASHIGSGTIRDDFFPEVVPQEIVHVVHLNQSESSEPSVCKRCQRGPSYHHGHNKDCPKSHYAKRQKREASLSTTITTAACKRCTIGPSYHKAHARHCPRSKFYQQTIHARDTRGRKKQSEA
jgi:hypothetical protein